MTAKNVLCSLKLFVNLNLSEKINSFKYGSPWEAMNAIRLLKQLHKRQSEDRRQGQVDSSSRGTACRCCGLSRLSCCGWGRSGRCWRVRGWCDSLKDRQEGINRSVALVALDVNQAAKQRVDISVLQTAHLDVLFEVRSSS